MIIEKNDAAAAAKRATVRDAESSIAILAAAMALPGVALAESAPEQGLIGFKYLYYKDYQPGLDRIHVSSPSLYVLTPLGREWSLEGSIVRDAVSGPSPRYHSAISSASPMQDERHAGDVRLVRYFRRAAVGFGAAFSTEDDYESRALSFDVRMSTDDNNTSIVLGAGYSDDTIKPNDTGGGSVTRDEKKKVNDFIVGVTQVVTPRDIVQANLTYSRGRGFFSDPYKFLDNRPRERNQTALLGRWNHHFVGPGATLRSSYRYYSDTFEVKAHTFGFEWVQPVRALTVTPGVRYHTQSAASFYVDPIPGSAFPPVVSLRPPYYSADHRLSAFGAITAGVKLALSIGKDWTIDAKFDYYEQRGDWRLGGTGSPGLAPFKAQFYQVGVYRRF